uniref:C2H2-type domain-containing protein n=1 Tax=Dicentrarchus labrax TaxID=13489 RepID=A0A8C4HZC1_DICLA
MSQSASQSSFFENINLHPTLKTCIVNNACRSKTELSSLESVTTHNPSNLISLPNFEQSNDCSLVCHICGKVFTYPKNFDKHQRVCVVSSKQQAETDPQCSTSLAHHSKLNPVPKAKESLTSETGTGPSVSPDSHQEQTRKRSRPDNTNGSHAEASSETAKTPTSADHAYDSQATSRTIKCTMCEKNFSEIVLMKRHYSQSHKVRGSYPCPLCKRTFVRLCELVRHQQNKKLYQCAVCKKCYTKPGLLSDHEKVHTASVTPRICETCGKSFKYLAHLVLHQRKHRERQPSVCSDCGKQFTQLKLHMVQHTEERAKHMRLRPFVCEICSKAFRLNNELKKHMMVHTGERPFTCPRCGKTFTRKSRLREHREKACL